MTARLWFRHDEVLPLVAHTATSPCRRITKAQARACARLRPAPIWTADGEDALSYKRHDHCDWADEADQMGAAGPGTR